MQLPIPDEHPCTERNGYGLSKYLMEELTKYFHRQQEDIDVVNFRFSVITPDENPAPLCEVGPICEWALGNIAVMCLSDTLRLIALALDAPHTPGVRIMNASAPVAWAKDPVADVLRGWYGDGVDVSYFEQPCHEWDSVYDVNRVRETYGFVAERLPKDVFGKEVQNNV
jgi:nucleoside-diphosphate-sugar epimerase